MRHSISYVLELTINQQHKAIKYLQRRRESCVHTVKNIKVGTTSKKDTIAMVIRFSHLAETSLTRADIEQIKSPYW